MAASVSAALSTRRSTAVLVRDVVDLRDRRVERVAEQQAGVAARGAPFGGRRGACRRRRETLDGPGGDLDGVMDRGLHADDLGEKAATTSVGIQGAPSRAVMSDGFRSSGWTGLERLDIAPIARIERGRGDRGGELGADRAGQIGVGGLPALDAFDRCVCGSRKMRSPSSAIASSRERPRSSAMRSMSTMAESRAG